MRPIRNYQLIGFTTIDEHVKILQEVRVMFKYLVIRRGIEFGMISAAIQGKIDCVDYISHVPSPQFGHFSSVLAIGQVPGSRLVGSDLRAWHRLWTDNGQLGN